MTQDYRVSFNLSRRRSKSRTFCVDEHLYPVPPNYAMTLICAFQCVGLILFVLIAYTAISIVQIIGNISTILRSHASQRIYSSNETLPTRPN